MLWAFVAAVLAVPVLVPVLVLVTPVRLAVRLCTDPWRFDLRLAPFAGLIGWVRLPHRVPRLHTSQPPAAQPQHPQPPDARRAALLRALPGFLAAVAERCRIDRLHLDLRFGTGDPALTGQIYGWLMPVAHGLAGAPTAQLQIVPQFDRACLAGNARVELRITPIRLAGPLIRLARAAVGRP